MAHVLLQASHRSHIYSMHCDLADMTKVRLCMWQSYRIRDNCEFNFDMPGHGIALNSIRGMMLINALYTSTKINWVACAF